MQFAAGPTLAETPRSNANLLFFERVSNTRRAATSAKISTKRTCMRGTVVPCAESLLFCYKAFAASLDSQAATDRLVGLLRHKDSSCAGSIRRWIRFEHKPRTRHKMQRVGKLAAIMQLSRELDASITATD